MSARVIRYRTKPECADENQQLIERVFAELDELGATGFSYATFRLDDGVSFVHVVMEDDGADASVSSPRCPPSRPSRPASPSGARSSRSRPARRSSAPIACCELRQPDRGVARVARRARPDL